MSYAILFFALGAILGSFYNVVGYRLPKGESLLYPSSHCPNCNHKLTPFELIPIISFFLQGGKCTNCKKKISWFYPIFESACGLLFLLAYLKFGFTLDLIVPLTFISLIIIIMVSDYEYMIISDEVLIFFGILLAIEIFFIYGWQALVTGIINGIISFVFMILLKLLGDFMFKKESMGGGDIKLMFIFGLALSYSAISINSIIAVVIGSFVGLPISLFVILNKKDHEIPFGPLLGIGAIILLLLGINVDIIKIF